MKRSTAFILIGAVLVALFLSMSMYTVDQRKAAVKFRLGEVVDVQTAPALSAGKPHLLFEQRGFGYSGVRN